jgi:hypothetical protein
MELETQRCQWCSAENPSAATFCSACGARLRPGPATGIPAAGPVGLERVAGAGPVPAEVVTTSAVPEHWPPPPGTEPAPRSRGPKFAVWSSVGVVVLLGLGLVGWRLTHHSLIGFPDLLAGRQHVTEGPSVAIVDTIDQIVVMGHHFRAAAYGDGALSFLVLAVDASSLPVPASALESFGAGFGAASSGSGLDLESEVSDVRAGVTYICAAIIGPTSQIAAGPAPSSACIWADERTTGWVITYADEAPVQALALTVQIRDGVVND